MRCQKISRYNDNGGGSYKEFCQLLRKGVLGEGTLWKHGQEAPQNAFPVFNSETKWMKGKIVWKQRCQAVTLLVYSTKCESVIWNFATYAEFLEEKKKKLAGVLLVEP